MNNWNPLGFCSVAAGLILAPFLLGIINRVKAMFAGRAGPPLLQVYYTLWKLLNKGAVYSKTTTWVFRAGPIVGLAAMLTAILLIPLGQFPAVIAFPGDLILLAYLLGLARFFTILAALDTGSPFEGMGASREAFYSALAEPALLLGLAALGHQASEISQTLDIAPRFSPISLSGIQEALKPSTWTSVPGGVVLALVIVALMLVTLVENCRIPFDDVNTHLELTMIHEVMVLDHSGPDFAYITYGACLKLWILGSLVVGLAFPCQTPYPAVNFGVAIFGMMVLAIVIGIIESVMARLRLLAVPQMLVGAAVLSAFALALQFGVAAK